MTTHSHIADQLPLYAAGALTPAEGAELEQHVRECQGCREELARIQAEVALMLMATPEIRPPERARVRLMSAVGRGSTSLAVGRSREGWWIAVPALAALVLLITTGVFWQRSKNLEVRLADVQDRLQQQQTAYERAQRIAETLASQEAVHATLLPAGTQPQPQGRVVYVPRTGSLVLLASNLSPLPPGSTYELWLLPESGAPLPAGTFQPDRRGSASLTLPSLPAGTAATGFAVTVEPAGGSQSPTMPIVISGNAS